MDRQRIQAELAKRTIRTLGIGASAGGIELLARLLPCVHPQTSATIVCVLHLAARAGSILVDVLQKYTSLPVREAEPGLSPQPGEIYLAPADYHLSFELDGSFSLSNEEPVQYCRPSIDVFFQSMAWSIGADSAGFLLTGANPDGASGLRALKEAGALTVVQEPSTARFAEMPAAAASLSTLR